MLTSHSALEPKKAAAAVELFQHAIERRHGGPFRAELIQRSEQPLLRGNLLGYLRAHEEILQRLSPLERRSFDTIVYIHDAGLATRMFPLSYEHGNPSKAAIRFPSGSALEMLLTCVAGSLPLIKGCALMIPIDQYFLYDTFDPQTLARVVSRHTLTTIVTETSVERALGSLGVVELTEDGVLSGFVEKPGHRSLIPQHTPDHTLANTFQLFSTIEQLSHLAQVVEGFAADPQHKPFVRQLDEIGWSFSELVFESLHLPRQMLSPAQAAFRALLETSNITLGGVVARGHWEDWAANGASYAKLLRALAMSMSAPDASGNYLVRSHGILNHGSVKSCYFIDCDTIDLLGDFENCVFVNCSRIRLMNCEKAANSLFYTLQEVNFFRREMSNYLYGRFLAGMRHYEFECELDARAAELFKAMDRITKSWERMPHRR
ncbi:MAG TPA: hypothetical protein VG963_18615 [Polyangiaceae bacterium]|nr:hypothetical protein [Polyangiaceae bacterium]